MRLRDPRSGPVVKITAAPDGAALGLEDGADGGIRLFANRNPSTIEVKQRDGRLRVLEPAQ